MNDTEFIKNKKQLMWNFVVSVIRLFYPDSVAYNRFDEYSIDNECPFIELCEWYYKQ